MTVGLECLGCLGGWSREEDVWGRWLVSWWVVFFVEEKRVEGMDVEVEVDFPLDI